MALCYLGNRVPPNAWIKSRDALRKNKDIHGSTRKGCKTCPDTLWFTLMSFLLSFVVEVADTLSRIVFRSFSLSLLLLAASGTIRAQAQDPFTQNRLPDLGMMPESHEGEKHFAEMAKAFGEASMKITIWILVNRRGNSLSDRYAMWSASRLTSSLKAGYQPGQRQRGY